MIKNMLKITLIIWIALWAVFFIRELVVKKNMRDYMTLFSRTLEGKHAYVTGDKLYAFLLSCKKTMPSGATYKMNGIEEGSIERRRAVYYLYPNVESVEPDYIIDASQYTVKKAGE